MAGCTIKRVSGTIERQGGGGGATGLRVVVKEVGSTKLEPVGAKLQFVFASKDQELLTLLLRPVCILFS